MPFLPMVFKMIMTRYAFHCIGFVLIVVGSVVGITFALDGWQAFFASIGFLLVALAGTAYFIMKMIKSFIKKQQENMQNLFSQMMGGNGGSSVNEGINTVELMSLMTQMGAGMSRDSTMNTKQIEASNTVDVKAVELDSSGNPIVSEPLDNLTINPFNMYANQVELPNMSEMSDDEVVQVMKSQMNQEDFSDFDCLSPEDKKEVIDSFRENDGEIFNSNMFEGMIKEMTPEEQKQAQEMMNQMMGMFGGLFGGMDNLPETINHQSTNENLVKNLEANMLLAANSNSNVTTVEDAVVVTTNEKVEVLVANIVEDNSTLKSIDNSNVPNIVKSSGEHVEFDLEKMQKMLAGNVSEKK